jgi:hypothetical protein
MGRHCLGTPFGIALPVMENIMPTLPEDEQVRGNAYLCQVGACVSCGSCCGLYNIRDLSRERLHAILADRTTAFAQVPRTIDAILAFEAGRMEQEGTDYPIENFHHCVFVGLIRDQGERVGCMLHPLAQGNGGVDRRGLSHYGGAACKHFFCPTYDELEPHRKRLVRTLLEDWYEYGLIIPEHRFLAALLDILEERTGRALDARSLEEPARKAVADLLRLRLDWPFRDPGAPGAWNFFSTRDTERPGLSDRTPRSDPRLLRILHELDTARDQEEQAARRLAELIDQATAAIGAK